MWGAVTIMKFDRQYESCGSTGRALIDWSLVEARGSLGFCFLMIGDVQDFRQNKFQSPARKVKICKSTMSGRRCSPTVALHCQPARHFVLPEPLTHVICFYPYTTSNTPLHLPHATHHKIFRITQPIARYANRIALFATRQLTHRTVPKESIIPAGLRPWLHLAGLFPLFEDPQFGTVLTQVLASLTCTIFLKM